MAVDPAAAVIAETFLPTAGRPLAVVPDADRAFARLCHALVGDPALRMRVIALPMCPAAA